MSVGMIGASGVVAAEGPPLRQRRIVVPLARVEASGSSNPTGTPSAVIFNPSRRLSCSISLAFEPDAPKAISSYTSSTWTLRAQRQNPETRKVCDLHTLESGAALPRMWEIDTAIRRVRVTTSLAVPTDVAAAAVAGNWTLIVEWEPNQFVCDEEATELLQLCSAKAEVNTLPILVP